MIEIEYSFKRLPHEIDNRRVAIHLEDGKETIKYFDEFTYPKFLEFRPMIGEFIQSNCGTIASRILNITHYVKENNRKHILLINLGN